MPQAIDESPEATPSFRSSSSAKPCPHHNKTGADGASSLQNAMSREKGSKRGQSYELMFWGFAWTKATASCRTSSKSFRSGRHGGRPSRKPQRGQKGVTHSSIFCFCLDPRRRRASEITASKTDQSRPQRDRLRGIIHRVDPRSAVVGFFRTEAAAGWANPPYRVGHSGQIIRRSQACRNSRAAVRWDCAAAVGGSFGSQASPRMANSQAGGRAP